MRWTRLMRHFWVQHLTGKPVKGARIILKDLIMEDLFWSAEPQFIRIDKVVYSTLGAKIWDAAGNADASTAEDDYVFSAFEEIDCGSEPMLKRFLGLIFFE